jgi:hypothetical protein
VSKDSQAQNRVRAVMRRLIRPEVEARLVDSDGSVVATARKEAIFRPDGKVFVEYGTFTFQRVAGSRPISHVAMSLTGVEYKEKECIIPVQDVVLNGGDITLQFAGPALVLR